MDAVNTNPNAPAKSERMAKLLRLMTSVNDAEALAATRKFFAECQRNGIDMMALSARLAEPTVEERVNAIRDCVDAEFDAAAYQAHRSSIRLTPQRVREIVAYIEAYATGLHRHHEELLARVRTAAADLVGEDAAALGDLSAHVSRMADHRKRQHGEKARRKAEREWVDHYAKRFAKAKAATGKDAS